VFIDTVVDSIRTYADGCHHGALSFLIAVFWTVAAVVGAAGGG
jgi:hemerythrin-like domain-containing protein